MKTEEAIEICEKWFSHLDNQRARTAEMQELAALAKQGSEAQKEAQRRLRQIDKTPRVFDGAYLEPAVKHLVRIILEGE